MADPIIPTMPMVNVSIDSLGHWLTQVDAYLRVIDQLEEKLTVAETAYGGTSMDAQVKAMVLIPGSGEFVYDTVPVHRYVGPRSWVTNNAIRDTPASSFPNGSASRPYVTPDKTDLIHSLDALQAQFPQMQNVSLVVSWFGMDLRIGSCELRPGTDNYSREPGATAPRHSTFPYRWMVNGQQVRVGFGTHPISLNGEGEANYGGTPADRSVVRCIQEMRRRGLKVTFYPFILMDVPPGNTLPNPWGGASQPTFPWRGRITCDPAPGMDGTVDGTATAREQVEAFVGTCLPEHFTPRPEYLDVAYGRRDGSMDAPDEWSYRRFILHYAHLCALAGGVDSFLIGSEMRSATWVRDENGDHPFVKALVDLAADVKAILGPETKVSYASDWSEFTAYQVPGGGLHFHLDPLWSSPNIDAIGIDNYWPLSDWRGVTGIDEEEYASIYDPVYLASNIEAGEGYDWYYASESDRINQVRTPITDGLGKPWVYRYKDIRNWWLNQHFNRTSDGAEVALPTAWVPQSKPFWMTEIGCPAIDKGTNQPNVFVDPKSSESFFPYFSLGTRDDLMQRRYIAALHTWYAVEAQNPISAVYKRNMVDTSRLYIYAWDARPYPEFPEQAFIWSDAPNWYRGHWITGSEVSIPWTELPPDLDTTEVDLMPAKPMPKGEPAVDPETGHLRPSMHHYLAQIEQIARRLQSLQIIAVLETTRE